ncbi:MAG: hypothetical protein VYD85_09205, partial [Pseudomonadota bacterium]|nr:hypothetical protein [Pseudomonadota bacterium]
GCACVAMGTALLADFRESWSIPHTAEMKYLPREASKASAARSACQGWRIAGTSASKVSACTTGTGA